MARETWVQSQVESYQRLKKWYLIPPCLTLSIIRYGSRVKWSNPWKGAAASSWCSSYRKGNLRVALDYSRQLYVFFTTLKKVLKKPIEKGKVVLKTEGHGQWVNCFGRVSFCEVVGMQLHLFYFGGARGVMVIVVGNGHGDTSSNPERDWLYFP